MPIVICRGVTFDACGSEPHPRGGAQSLRCFADSPVVQPRKNARRTSGKCGFDSHRARHFRRAVEFGLSVKSERMSGFKSRPSRQMAGFPTRFCPSPLFDGSQDWVILDKDAVAGSSPAFGSTCRSSSVGEHVIPSSSLIRRSSQPCRKMVILTGRVVTTQSGRKSPQRTVGATRSGSL